jgi:hypothetical protein
MIQYAFTCATLSSISRPTAIVRRSITALGFLMCASPVLSGWNARGMNVWNPPVEFCNSRNRSK